MIIYKTAQPLFSGDINLCDTKNKDLFDVHEASKYLNVPKNTIYHWSSEGRLDDAKIKVGKQLRFEKAKLLDCFRKPPSKRKKKRKKSNEKKE